MLVQLTPQQARVIGVLLEKETTTPEQYPLSLNALTLGCNQKSNREPVMQLSEIQVQEVLDELNAMHLLLEEPSSRVIKYKHRFCNTEFSSLQFTLQQRALICVLLLRGPQTPGELRNRSNRLADFANVTEVEQCLESLHEHDGEQIVVRLSREPGKRESRFAHLFSGQPRESKHGVISEIAEASDKHQCNDYSNKQAANAELVERVNKLEEQVSNLQSQIELLTEIVG